MTPVLSLVPVWTALLAFTVAYYVLTDGFDLGVGMLFGFVRREDRRQVMMQSVAPIWDGNETWLVLGGLSLLAAFPLAYTIIIPAVYFPVLIMLLGLVFRGVAFEFRFKDPRLRRMWDLAFCAGSAIATLAQGLVLGTFIQGIPVNGRQFAGSVFGWATPFAFVVGVALMLGYGLLGAGWLVLKTEGELQDWCRRAGRVCLVGTMLGLLAVSVWTPFANARIADRWFSFPNVAWLWLVPLATVAVAVSVWRALARTAEVWPFVGAITLFLLSFLGLAISLWPMIVPFHYTLWEAASSESTQAFLLIGTLFLVPLIVVYSGWSYYVFRGKARGDFERSESAS